MTGCGRRQIVAESGKLWAKPFRRGSHNGCDDRGGQTVSGREARTVGLFCILWNTILVIYNLERIIRKRLKQKVVRPLFDWLNANHERLRS
mgnify:CR=1 FL=1